MARSLRLAGAAAAAAVLAACACASLASAEHKVVFAPKHTGYDGRSDVWFLNDKDVEAQTKGSLFSSLATNSWAAKDYDELNNSFGVVEHTTKKGFQTFDNRLDVKDFEDIQFVGLYDGINQPSVVNRLRSALLSEIANNCVADIKRVQAAFEAAKLAGGNELIDAYLHVKDALFKQLVGVIKHVDQQTSNSKTRAAASVAVAIIVPQFVIVVQVGNVHIFGFKDMRPVELTIDQSRASALNETNTFRLLPCKNPLDLELCATTRVMGAPSAKEAGKRTHVNEPFIKLYKRVYAPYLNDDDLVENDTSVSELSLLDVADEANEDAPRDSADKPIKAHPVEATFDAADDESLVNETLNDIESLRYLVFLTEPVAQAVNADQVAKLVHAEFTAQFKRQVGSIKSIINSALRNIFNTFSAVRSSGSGFSNFVTNFFSDVSVAMVVLETEPAKYHY